MNKQTKLMIEKIEKEFWEEIFKIDREIPKRISRVHKFGYKIRQGNSFFTITDWGNVWSWLSSELSKEYERGRKGGIKEVGKALNEYDAKVQIWLPYQVSRILVKLLGSEKKGVKKDE